MTKGQRYLGDDKEGNPIIEFYDVENNGVVYSPDYDQTVSELIRQKYSLDDELSLNSKSMQIFINSCTDEQRAKWMIEINEFTDYREECISKAKLICNK